MLYKKIVIFLLLSQASCSLVYGSEEQNKVTSKNKNLSEEQGRTIISWNGLNYLFINNLYYFSTRKYTFMDASFYNVYIKYRRKSATPSYLEKEYSFFPRIQEFLYNLFSFSLYFFKKSFFYKIDILGNDVFFYPMTADYTTNILSIILGTTACKISLRDDMELECRFGIGLTWRRLSYSYAVSYKCKSCMPDEIDVTGAIDIIDNKLFYGIKYTGEALGIGVRVVEEEGVWYKDTVCKYTLKFSILENLKKSYTWKHFDIVINCSFLLRSKVTIYVNLNFGILEAWQVFKCYNVKYEYSNENILTFSIPLVLRHLSLNVSYSS